MVADATTRILDNPEGVKARQSALDDFSEREELANATADVYFTAAELRRLTPPMPTAGSLRYC